MTGDWLRALALSLLLTWALEGAFYWLLGRRKREDLLLCLLVNLLTNPPVVLCHLLTQAFTSWPLLPVMLALELTAVLVEGFVLKHMGEDFRRPYLFSLGANGFSFFVGLLLKRIL